MNAIALGPILVLLGVIVGVVAVAVAVGRRRSGGALTVFATIFGLLFLGAMFLALFTVRIAPSGPQAVVVSSSSSGDVETIVPVPSAPEMPHVYDEAADANVKSRQSATARHGNSHEPIATVPSRQPKNESRSVTLYGQTKRSIANHWPQQLLTVAILMVIACLMKVVADGRLGRSFGTAARIGAAALVLVLVSVVWELGPRIWF